MTFDDIVSMLKRGMEKTSLSDRLKFDCGDDGQIVLGPDGVLLGDNPADCTIRMTTENLGKLLTGKLNPMTGVVMGKLKISGDASVAMKLGQLLKG